MYSKCSFITVPHACTWWHSFHFHIPQVKIKKHKIRILLQCIVIFTCSLIQILHVHMSNTLVVAGKLMQTCMQYIVCVCVQRSTKHYKDSKQSHTCTLDSLTSCVSIWYSLRLLRNPL